MFMVLHTISYICVTPEVTLKHILKKLKYICGAANLNVFLIEYIFC